jgi:hypothetical protein
VQGRSKKEFMESALAEGVDVSIILNEGLPE